MKCVSLSDYLHPGGPFVLKFVYNFPVTALIILSVLPMTRLSKKEKQRELFHNFISVQLSSNDCRYSQWLLQFLYNSQEQIHLPKGSKRKRPGNATKNWELMFPSSELFQPQTFSAAADWVRSCVLCRECGAAGKISCGCMFSVVLSPVLGSTPELLHRARAWWESASCYQRAGCASTCCGGKEVCKKPNYCIKQGPL